MSRATTVFLTFTVSFFLTAGAIRCAYLERDRAVPCDHPSRLVPGGALCGR